MTKTEELHGECETPLVDLLEGVPLDARMIYEESPTHSHSIPVGVLCSKAAAALREFAGMLDAEPVAWIDELKWAYSKLAYRSFESMEDCLMMDQIKLILTGAYDAHPPAPTTPLTDEEIRGLWRDVAPKHEGNWVLLFARAIERAHGITQPGAGSAQASP